jgi:hypothetical protein
MLAVPSRDWSVFKPLCADHWEPFQRAPPRSQTAYDDDLVATRLAGGNPEHMGDLASRCVPCGQGQPLGAMSCPSSLCFRCATVSVDPWGSQGRQVLHAGVRYRHISLTVPALVRTTFSHNAAVVWSALRRCGVPCLDDGESEVRGQGLKGGDSVVLHTPGRHGPSHPQRQLLAPRGGEDKQGEGWEPLQDLPSALLRRKGPWPVRSTWRTTLAPDASKRLGEVGCRQSPHGLVTNVPQGAVPSQAQSLARSVAQDVVSPPRSVRRIARYEGERGTDQDRSHRTERVAQDTVDVLTFIGRRGQPTLPQGCTRSRYDGVPATQPCAQVQVLMREALAQGEGVVQGAVQILARLPSRQR